MVAPEALVAAAHEKYAKQHGAEAYRAKLESASGYFHWLADRARGKFDMRTPEGRMDAFKFLLPTIQNISDKLERAAIANDVAGYLGVEQGVVLDQLKRSATDRRAPVASRPPVQPSLPALERILLTALLAGDEIREQILPRITPSMSDGFQCREIIDTLRQMAEADVPISFTGLEGRLSAQAQNLLHLAIAADDTSDETQLVEHAYACLRRLESDRRRAGIDELRARVKAAEAEGRLEEALRLMAELTRIEKEYSEV